MYESSNSILLTLTRGSCWLPQGEMSYGIVAILAETRRALRVR